MRTERIIKSIYFVLKLQIEKGLRFSSVQIGRLFTLQKQTTQERDQTASVLFGDNGRNLMGLFTKFFASASARDPFFRNP